jgi:uncharacterized Zn-finger protein
VAGGTSSPSNKSSSSSLERSSDRQSKPTASRISRHQSTLQGNSYNKVRESKALSSIPDREYILTLADPSYPTIGSSETINRKEMQKHPAKFQCPLCPKLFTRDYNLRSHLRIIHTDVCIICGKAFARQQDRKRHEGRHSGEGHFDCKGELKS